LCDRGHHDRIAPTTIVTISFAEICFVPRIVVLIKILGKYMKIESEDIDVESLLVSSYFHVPRFQRPYSWDDENLIDFWNDLITNKDNDYFIGSMVVYKIAKQQYGVVDGQQRLTSITILLCVIRNEMEALGRNDLALGLHQLIERKNRENKDEYVIKTESSFPYFQEHIQKFGHPERRCCINPAATRADVYAQQLVPQGC
jgi:hypothetical protein